MVWTRIGCRYEPVMRDDDFCKCRKGIFMENSRSGLKEKKVEEWIRSKLVPAR